MKKIILTYGMIAGVVTLLSMTAVIYLTGFDETKNLSAWLGYLIMLVALSAIFVGIKQYRDQELGGVVKFGTAFLLGLGISAVAGLAYAGSWEIYLALTDYVFIDEYTQSEIAKAVSNGIGGAELAELEQEMQDLKLNYNKVLFRLPMTFLELFPVGLLISLISAAVLRNSNVLRATA